MPSSHLILYRPLLLLPSVFLSIRVKPIGNLKEHPVNIHLLAAWSLQLIFLLYLLYLVSSSHLIVSLQSTQQTSVQFNICLWITCRNDFQGWIPKRYHGASEVEGWGPGPGAWAFFFFFWLYCWVACGILIPPLGIESAVLALGAWGLNHWATRGGPLIGVFFARSNLTP